MGIYEITFFAQTQWSQNAESSQHHFLVHEDDIVKADAHEVGFWGNVIWLFSLAKSPIACASGNMTWDSENQAINTDGCISVNQSTHFNSFFPREEFIRQQFRGTFDKASMIAHLIITSAST